MSEIYLQLDVPPVLTGAPIPPSVAARLTDLEDQVGDIGSVDPLTIENRLTVAQADITALQGSSTPETASTIGTLIAGSADKATPDDADSLAISDSAAAGILKRLSWANIKTALSSVFAVLGGSAGGQTLNGGNAVSQNLTLSSTAHATKGYIYAGPVTVQESTGRIGMSVSVPTYQLDAAHYQWQVGADSNSSIRTNNTSKSYRFSCAHYANAEEPVGILFLQATSNAASSVSFGGGSSLLNAVSECRFFTAADAITTTGNQVMTITAAQRVVIGATTAPAAKLSSVATTEQLRLGYDVSNYLSFTVGASGGATIAPTGGTVDIQGAGTFSLTNATTNAAVTVGTLTKNVTGAGVGAVGLGPRLIFAAESSTTVDTQQADITATWTDATHATRKSRLALSASDSAAAREGLRIEADGSVARVGFFGAAAVVKPAALTATVAAAPAGGTGSAAGAWDTSGNRDIAIACINNLKTRVDQLESKLQALGLLT